MSSSMNAPMQSGLLDSQQQSEVAEIRSFLDETYTSPLGGSVKQSYSNSQLPWGRIGIEKFIERTIPIIQSKASDSSFFSIKAAIRSACKTSISFGNATVVIDGDGSVRVATPETAQARIDPFGVVTFTEVLDGVISVAVENGGKISTSVNGDDFVETESRAFSIFYGSDGAHPFGASRLSPAVRNTIRAASRNKVRAEIASNFFAFPQRIINGAWEGMDSAVYDNARKLQSGAATVMVFPRDDQGQKMEVSQLPAADFTPYLSMHRQYATEVATGLGVDFSDLGVVTATPQSADAIYATRESMSLAVEEFEAGVTDTLQKALIQFCDVSGINEDATLIWREPALPSKASAADAAIKMASAFPFLQNSEAMLAWAGIPANVLDSIAKEGVISRYNPDNDMDDDTNDDGGEDSEEEDY